MVGTTGQLGTTPPGDGSPPGDRPPDGDGGVAAYEVDPDHRLFQPVSTRGPALIVLGIAVFIVVLGTVASVLASNGRAPTTRATVTIAGNTVVPMTPATTALKSVIAAGQPPADILGALSVPAASTVVRSVDSDQGTSQYDRTVYFTTGLTGPQVVQVFTKSLPSSGWKVIYHGDGALQDADQTEVLGKRGSGDGFYWEVGVVVSPATSAGITPYSVEVFELPDAD